MPGEPPPHVPTRPSLPDSIVGVAMHTEAAAMAAAAIDGLAPGLIARPRDAEATTRLLRACRDAGAAVVLRGGGTSLGLGASPSRYDVCVDLSALDGVVAYAPDALTVTVRAGLRMADLQSLLAANGQTLPLDVADPATATVGGALAAAQCGPRTATYGRWRDWLISARIALADGTVVQTKAGEALHRGVVGSLGTLGALVEASFRMWPRPERDVWLTWNAPSLDMALETAARFRTQPLPITAAVALNGALAKAAGLPGPTLALRVEGGHAAVEAACAAIMPHCPDMQAHPTEAPRWQAIVDATALRPRGAAVRVRVHVPPAALGGAVAALRSAAADPALLAYADAGVAISILSAPTPSVLRAMVERVRDTVRGLGGRLEVEYAPAQEKAYMDLWGDTAGIASVGASGGAGDVIRRRLKDRCDPAGILSPGRLARSS